MIPSAPMWRVLQRLRFVPAALLLFALGASRPAHAQSQGQFDIGGAGTPSITGAVNGTVTVSNPSPLVLTVDVNFGEVSPVNRNAIVVVRVPVAIRSDSAYAVTASVTGGSAQADPDALQQRDVGIGLANFRRMADGQLCPASQHLVHPPFNNDPSQTVNRVNRAAYPSSLATLGPATVVATGPQLSTRLNLRPPILPSSLVENGHTFDVVLAVVPQFFLPSSTTFTLSLTIAAGPTAPCN